jgi:hypothetical protein
MSVFTPEFAGQVNVKPRLPRLFAPKDTLATITTAGYLNSSPIIQTNPPQVGDFIFAVYNGGQGIFTVTITAGVVTLVPWVDAGNVLLPVVNGNIPMFNGTLGQISDSNILATNLVVKNAVNTMAAGSGIVLAKVNGTESAGAVTANGVSGVITTSSLTTAALSAYSIAWTNTFITATSNILFTLQGGTNTNKSIVFQVAPGAGSATLLVNNIAAVSALNGTVFIGYTIF